MQEYYDLLEVYVGCKESEIKASYRKLAKRYHPDINPNGTEKFKKISEAYEWLMKNHSTYKPSIPNKSKTQSSSYQWWDIPKKEEKLRETTFVNRIFKKIEDLQYERKTGFYIIKIKESEAKNSGIVTVTLKNGISHNISYSKDVVDGSIATVGFMNYKIKIYSDDDWTISPMFNSSWLD